MNVRIKPGALWRAAEIAQSLFQFRDDLADGYHRLFIGHRANQLFHRIQPPPDCIRIIC